jgi:hypothetical protein
VRECSDMSPESTRATDPPILPGLDGVRDAARRGRSAQSIHLPMLRQLAIAVGIAERARAELEEGELCVRGSRGATLNPAFRAWSQAVALIARLSVEFGGSPAALTHIGLSQLRGKSLQQELAEKYGKAT